MNRLRYALVLIIMSIAILFFSIFVHETGHYLACVAIGGTCVMDLSGLPFSGAVHMSGNIGEHIIFLKASGGLFAGGIFAIAAKIARNRAVKDAFAINFIVQIIYAVLEVQIL